jgi:hypothetical protein
VTGKFGSENRFVDYLYIAYRNNGGHVFALYGEENLSYLCGAPSNRTIFLFFRASETMSVKLVMPAIYTLVSV